MIDERLLSFVRAAKAKGVADDSLVAMLRQNGWQERRVYAALSTYYAETLGVAVPARGSSADWARDAFLYLISFITLGAWVYSLVHLGDALVDHSLPSMPRTYYYSTFAGSVSGYLATIILAFPIQIWVNVLIAREVQRRPEALESPVRKWLTYVALVAAALVLLADGIWFVSDFITGELTLSFLLKSLVLVVLTGGVFWYYLGSIRIDEVRVSRDRAFSIAAGCAVVLGLFLGFVPVGSPEHQRSLAFDAQRINDLYNIAVQIYSTNAVGRYRAARLAGKPITMEPLPAPSSLAEVTNLSPTVQLDPETRVPYTYTPLEGPSYRLCAHFNAPTQGMTVSAWAHTAGYDCFTLDASRFPPGPPPQGV
jgi:hypothetical protein